MADSKTYEITLRPDLAERIDETSRRVYVRPEELILFLLLAALRDLDTGKKDIPYYKKILRKLREDLNYESGIPENDGNST